MNIHFDSKVAKVVGVDGAIMLNYFNFWIIKNEANNKHFYDGHYWTYNSMEAFTKIFDFWSKRQIERILKNLKDKEYIITGNYNDKQYDRTCWYSLTEKGKALIDGKSHEHSFHQTGKCISPNGEMHITKPCHLYHIINHIIIQIYIWRYGNAIPLRRVKLLHLKNYLAY